MYFPSTQVHHSSLVDWTTFSEETDFEGAANLTYLKARVAALTLEDRHKMLVRQIKLA